ncbi:MAG: SpoIIE family protein phosphatase, partial [Pseudomonadota bacterium]
DGNELYALPPNQQNVLHFTVHSNSIRSLLTDQQGRLWVTTDGNRLSQLLQWTAEDAKFHNIVLDIPPPPKHKLPIYNLLDDSSGRLWDAGVMYNPKTQQQYMFSEVDGVDLGINWQGSAAKLRDGGLLFGGGRGVLLVRPENFKPWNYQPAVIASSVSVDGQTIPPASVEDIVLVPSAKGFSVEFTLLDYSAPRQNRYAFKLEGYDDDWTEADAEQRTATYTNLAPGDYTLYVKGSNRIGVWSPHQLVLPVIVQPAFYETQWFRALLVLFFATILYLAYRARINQLNRQAAEKAEKQQRALSEAQEKQRIAEENLRLQQENGRMAAELDVSQALQNMVLPTDEELAAITPLDIACWMESADEVGGDYYDVLRYHDKVFVGIGDVTGHGLESGALMLMVQTAIRTLSISKVDNPATFFQTLNRTFYDNVKRMGLDRNMTLLMLDYDAGHFRISGQHEEVLVIRQNGALERLDTIDLGFFLGVVEDIEQFIHVKEFELQTGDSVVLYTDGVTEAFNDTRQQYGIERFCHVLQENRAKSSSSIRDAIVQDLRQYVGDTKMKDDFSFVVIKQAD